MTTDFLIVKMPQDRFILSCNGLQNVYSSKAMNTNDKRRKNSFTEIFKKNLVKYKFEN